MTETRITAVLLAGGAGRRMQGRDKGLEQYKGKGLIEWVVDSIEPQVDDIIISINRNRALYSKLGYPTVLDRAGFDERQGPIAGLTAALNEISYSESSKILVAPCDTPLLPKNYVKKLNAELVRSDAEIAVVHDGSRRQNLHCLINSSMLTNLIEYYDSGGRAMHRWFAQHATCDVDFSAEARTFLNVNSLNETEL